MWILSLVQSQIGATNPDMETDLRGKFLRKHYRKKFKRKVNLNSSISRSEFNNNTSRSKENDGESSDCDKVVFPINKLTFLDKTGEECKLR